MNIRRFMTVGRCFVAVIAALTGSVAAAQSYPNRPVKIVVPSPPTGTSDFLARLVAPKLSTNWGVPVVVENRPGASGNIGMEVVAKSPADGYTLVMTNSAVAINVGLFPKLGFNVIQDFQPLGLIGSTPMVVTVTASLPIDTVAGLTAYAKQNPGRLAYGSCGIGTPQHLAIELYRSMTGTEMLHVPYSGCAPAVTDTISGQVQLLATTASQAAQHVQSGALRALAVTAAHRSLTLPSAPTFAEAGLAGYDLDIWFGLMAPAKTQTVILEQIYREVRSIVQSKPIAERMRIAGVDELLTTRDVHAMILKQDVEKYLRLIRSLDLAADSR